MTPPPWGGRKVRALLLQVLALKGDVCHLCGMPGANSPDHDPPRSVLLREGHPNPDALRFLFPSHRLCNFVRHDRPITDAVRAQCRARYRASLGLDDPSPSLSPSLLRRRPVFESDPTARKPSLPVSPPGPQKKTGRS